MHRDIHFDTLAEVLGRCGIITELRDLSDDDVNIRSGLCEVGGRKVLIIDRRLNADGRIEAGLAALKTLNPENIYLPPAIREMIGLPEDG